MYNYLKGKKRKIVTHIEPTILSSRPTFNHAWHVKSYLCVVFTKHITIHAILPATGKHSTVLQLADAAGNPGGKDRAREEGEKEENSY